MNRVTQGDLDAIRSWYTEHADADKEKFDLAGLASMLGRTKQFVSRLAGRMGLTKYSRPLGDDFRAQRSQLTKHQFETNGHPKGMLGKKHSEKFKAEQSARVRARVFTPEQKEAKIEKMMNTKIERYGSGRPNFTESSNPYSRAKHGRREDLGNRYFRSAWEANYARYLNWLIEQGEIVSWEYEPQTFIFHGVTRGAISYLPDFKVLNKDGSYEWHEVKGWMTSKDRTKLRRMEQYYPQEKVVLVDQKAYRSIAQWKSLIPNWE